MIRRTKRLDSRRIMINIRALAELIMTMLRIWRAATQ
jgi:hypothetical protein